MSDVRNAELFRRIDAGFREVFRLKKYLTADIPAIFGNPGLNHTHYRTMMYLSRHGPDCMKGIHQHLGIEAGSFTPVADRLIREGLADRRTDPDDRRRTLLHLTDRGIEKIDRLKAIIHEQTAGKLAVLDDRLLNDLAAAMETFRRVNEAVMGNDE